MFGWSFVGWGLMAGSWSVRRVEGGSRVLERRIGGWVWGVDRWACFGSGC